MQNFKQNIKFLILALVVGLSVSYAFAWTGPTSSPPNGDVPAPINVGASTQTKSGPLKVGGFRSFLPSYINYDSSVDLSSKDPSFQTLSLAVNGKVGATAYCDQDGNNCSGSSGAPSGEVAAFYLSTCPSGWVPANGTGGTVDLRGVFVRGLDNGRGLDTDTNPRTLGSYQADIFKAHSHVYAEENVTQGIKHGDSGEMTAAYTSVQQNTSAVGGSETRPKNVALLYCQKS